MRLLAATTNKNKLRELSVVSREFGIEIVSPETLISERGNPPTVDENEATYLGNAYLKAVAYSEWSGMDALGDDSGIEAEILGNRPGIFSARFGGAGITNLERNQLLLREIQEEADRQGEENLRGRFRCALVLARRDGSFLESESEMSGTFLYEPKGDKGFGYDSILLIGEIGRTLAELDFEETCRVGFRGKAAREIFRILRGLPNDPAQK